MFNLPKNPKAEAEKAPKKTKGKAAKPPPTPEQIKASVRDKVLKVLRGTKPANLSLKSPFKLKKEEIAYQDEVLGELVNEGRAYLLTIGKKELLLGRPPRVDDLFAKKHLTMVGELVKFSQKYRKPPLTSEEIVAFLNGPQTACPASCEAAVEAALRELVPDALLGAPTIGAIYQRATSLAGEALALPSFHEALRALWKKETIIFQSGPAPALMDPADQAVTFEYYPMQFVHTVRCRHV
jgi:hypothetical protein